MHAFLIVDVQVEFEVPPELVARIKRRSEEFPLRIFTRYINPPGTLFRSKLQRTSCPPGSKGTELVITPQNGDIVLDKPSYGLRSDQIEPLRARGVTEVSVSGVDTDACVLAVMFSLWDAGIDVHLQPELCWSSAGLHDKAVEIAMQQFGR